MKFENHEGITESFIKSIEIKFMEFIEKYPALKTLLNEAENIHGEITVANVKVLSGSPTAEWNYYKKTIKFVFPSPITLLTLFSSDELKLMQKANHINELSLNNDKQKALLYPIFDSIVFELCNATNDLLMSIKTDNCSSRDIYALLLECAEYQSLKKYQEITRLSYRQDYSEFPYNNDETWEQHWTRVNLLFSYTHVSHAESYRKIYDIVMKKERIRDIKDKFSGFQLVNCSELPLEWYKLHQEYYEYTQSFSEKFNFVYNLMQKPSNSLEASNLLVHIKSLKEKFKLCQQKIQKMEELKFYITYRLGETAYSKYCSCEAKDPKIENLLLTTIEIIKNIDNKFTPIIAEQNKFLDMINKEITSAENLLLQKIQILQDQEKHLKMGIFSINSKFPTLEPLSYEEVISKYSESENSKKHATSYR